MLRVQSGDITQYIPFVAVDATDLKTRETTSTLTIANITVYRQLAAGSATLWTTPTIAESSAANMPGVYTLLLDEGMSLTEGKVTEVVTLHIKDSGGIMNPTTISFELFAIPGVYRDSSSNYTSVLTGVGAQTATLAAITAATDLFAGCSIEIVAGTGKGQVRGIVSNTNAANPVCTLDNAWTTQPTGATYRIWVGSQPSTIESIADAVHDEDLSGHTTAGTHGKAIADIDTNAAAILVDTGTTL